MMNLEASRRGSTQTSFVRRRVNIFLNKNITGLPEYLREIAYRLRHSISYDVYNRLLTYAHTHNVKIALVASFLGVKCLAVHR